MSEAIKRAREALVDDRVFPVDRRRLLSEALLEIELDLQRIEARLAELEKRQAAEGSGDSVSRRPWIREPSDAKRQRVDSFLRGLVTALVEINAREEPKMHDETIVAAGGAMRQPKVLEIQDSMRGLYSGMVEVTHLAQEIERILLGLQPRDEEAPSPAAHGSGGLPVFDEIARVLELAHRHLAASRISLGRVLRELEPQEGPR